MAASCAYCESDAVASLAQCVTCRRHFCNSAFHSQGTSHIVMHMSRSRHAQVALCGSKEVLSCSLCGNRNPFSLGGVRVGRLECRDGCEGAQVLTEAELNRLPPIISMKSFVPLVLSEAHNAKVEELHLGVIERLEYLWREDETVSVRDVIRPKPAEQPDRKELSRKGAAAFQSPAEYVRWFNEMLFLEMKTSRRREVENSLLPVDSCHWDLFQCDQAVLRLRFDSKRIQVGQELRLILNEYPAPGSQAIWVGEVKEVRLRELRVRVDNIDRIPPPLESIGRQPLSYLLHADAWTDVVFQRMKQAVSLVQTDWISRDIVSRILTGSSAAPTQATVFPVGLPAPTVAPYAGLLNESQNRAVAMALRESVSLIQGPPGTGKTTVCVEIVRRARLQGHKVLVCAPSNVVADHLAEKIKANSRASDVVRVAARSREVLESSVQHLMLHTLCAQMDAEYARRKRKLQKGGLKSAKKRQLKQYCTAVEVARLRRAEVVVMTCVCAGDERVSSSLKFQTVVVDEATQTVEPGCLIPLTLATQRVVLVGDHKQLGPVVLNTKAKQAGFDVSMFERLVQLDLPMTRLDVQFRMHPAISAFSSAQFYDGTLLDGVDEVARGPAAASAFPWPDRTHPVFFWHVQGQEELDSQGSSYLNRQEALKVLDVVARLQQDGSRDVGVITFYSAQKELLTSKFPGPASAGYGSLEICSVDGFQGREKDFIVLSTVRADSIGFLKEFRRLNVALTRAKFGLIICGNIHTMLNSNDPTWLALLTHLDRRHAIFHGPTLDALEPMTTGLHL